jgi:hypothetical protein
MANVCKNTITVIGSKEAPELFVKALSKAMFGLDLNNLDPKLWGEDPNVDGKRWYGSLVEEFRQEGVYASRWGILYPAGHHEQLGLTAPRYYVETKWKSAVDEVFKASTEFPDLRFHLAWWRLQDGPAGEVVMRNGEIVEEVQRLGSWYLFDWRLCYPTISLLPAHLPYTLAQRGALRVQNAISAIEDLRGVLDDDRFIESPFADRRDPVKLAETHNTLDALLEHMRIAAKQLTFDDVFISEGGRNEK